MQLQSQLENQTPYFIQILNLDPANLTDNLAQTTPCAAVEVVLPVVMMELASQILEVDSARMRKRNALRTLSVAEAHAGALELHPCYVPAIHIEAL